MIHLHHFDYLNALTPLHPANITNKCLPGLVVRLDLFKKLAISEAGILRSRIKTLYLHEITENLIMDKPLKGLTQTLQIQYGLFLFFPLMLFLAFQFGYLQMGIYEGDVKLQYILGTISILVTTALVPLSLKLFGYVMKKYIKPASLPVAMRLYKNWSAIRLLLLGIVTLVNAYVYFTTWDKAGGLCALIGLTASLFCFPYEKKIKQELDITNKLEE